MLEQGEHPDHEQRYKDISRQVRAQQPEKTRGLGKHFANRLIDGRASEDDHQPFEQEHQFLRHSVLAPAIDAGDQHGNQYEVKHIKRQIIEAHRRAMIPYCSILTAKNGYCEPDLCQKSAFSAFQRRVSPARTFFSGSWAEKSEMTPRRFPPFKQCWRST